MRVERLLAPNPGPFTGPGTNTYVITAAGRSLIIDPGPEIEEHLTAVHHALQGTDPVAVVVTHTHPDHAPAANPLGAHLGIPVLGFAPGPSFVPTAALSDGDRIEIGDGTTLEAIHTPGHTSDHLCFLTGRVLFTGDHIIGGSTVVIEDAAAYMSSLQRVLELEPEHLYPGHGPELPHATEVINDYIAHRRQREREVLAAVAGGATTIPEVVEVVYGALDPELVEAAAMQVRTQLAKLQAEGRVECEPDASGSVVISLTMEDG